MTSIIHEWLKEDAKPIAKKLISARIPLTTSYKIDVLLRDFDKTQTEVIQAALDIGLTTLINDWRDMQSNGKGFPIDEEIEIMKDQGQFRTGEEDA